jgi:Ca2+-binding RTX toxin-like protein
VIFAGTRNADIFVGTAQSDQFFINNVGDVITGGNSQDQVSSSLSDYTLAAGLGSLVLRSGAINGTGNALTNNIEGNVGDNILDGGAGNDLILGGAGRDTFLFSHAGQSHADSLQDFQAGVDRIAVRGSAFGLLPGQAFSYVEGSRATTALPTFLRQGTAGSAQSIFFDRDGTGPAKAQLLCSFSPFAGKTSAADFAIL